MDDLKSNKKLLSHQFDYQLGSMLNKLKRGKKKKININTISIFEEDICSKIIPGSK
jgi:hypothetical protein